MKVSSFSRRNLGFAPDWMDIDGHRAAPRHYEWMLRIPGLALLAVAVWVIGMSVMGVFPFQ